MGAHVVILGAALLASPPDTLPVYADSATARLVARAIERHAAQDTTVSDYRAQLRYRVSFGLGRSRWELVPTAAVEEQQISVAWQRPNDLQVEVIGRRARSRSEGMDLSSIFDRPWFIPRGVGDSIRVFGADFPERGALHPLAAEGPDWYRYAIVDSLRVTDPGGRQLDLVALRVLPRRSGLALIAGKLWLDRATAEVDAALSRLFTYAAWADKHDGAVHGVPFRGVTLAMNEPVGVVGIAAPEDAPLLGFVSLVAPAIATGNTVVVVPSQAHPLVATDFYGLLETSDVPGGVVNIVTGEKEALARILAEHLDVDGLWFCGSVAGARDVEEASGGNMKRTWIVSPRDWFDAARSEGREFLRRATEVKNIWIPYGE